MCVSFCVIPHTVGVVQATSSGGDWPHKHQLHLSSAMFQRPLGQGKRAAVDLDLPDEGATSWWGKPGQLVDPACCMARTNARQQCQWSPLTGSNLCKLHTRFGTRYGLIHQAPTKLPRTYGSPSSSEQVGPAHAGDNVPVPNVGSAQVVGDEPLEPPPDLHAMAPPMDLEAVWHRLWSEVSVDTALASDNPVLSELHNYVLFTEMFRVHQVKLGQQFLSTPVGDIGASEDQLLAYLAYQRSHHCGKGASTKKPLCASTLLKRVGKIRSGLQVCDVANLPAWAHFDAPHSYKIKRAIATWSVADAHHLETKAVHEKKVLYGFQIESFCCKVIVDDMQSGVDDLTLCGALALRVQSATNLRCGNVLHDIVWNDVSTQGIGVYGSIQVMNTKRLSPSAGSATLIARMQAKVFRYVDDKITGYLFFHWCHRHMAGRLPNEHFFPAFVGNEMHWDQPLQQKTYLTIIRGCVGTLGLEGGDPLKAQLYTSTSIRVGNTNLTEESVARYRAQRNKDLGWVKDSTVPLSHYTSDSVALAPGPLFWDIGDCDANFDNHVHSHQVQKFTSMMCTQCGAPSCSCKYCRDRARFKATGAASNPKGSHTCWKAGVRTSGAMPAVVAEDMANRWLSLGCTLELCWDSSGKAYKFA